MTLTELLLDRFLKRDIHGSETLDSVSVATDQSVVGNSLSSGDAANDINTSTEGIKSDKLNGPIPTSLLNIADLGWTQTCVFSKTDADTVSWGAGSFISANGTTYAISAGNTGNMTAKTYIYLDLNMSSSVYQISTNIADPIGPGKVLIAVAENGASSATYMLVQTTQIVGDNILANTINANKITAGSITATQISSSYVYAGTISANQINAGTLTGITIQTQSSGQRVVLTSTLASYYNSSGTKIVETYASLNSWLVRGIQSTSAIWLDAGYDSSVAIGSGGDKAVLVDYGSYPGIYPYEGATATSGMYNGNQTYNWYQTWTRKLYVDDSISLNGDTITSWSDIQSDPTQSQIEDILVSIGGMTSVTLRVRRVTSAGVDSGWYQLSFDYGLLTNAVVN